MDLEQKVAFGQQEVHVNSSVNCLILDMPFVLCLISLNHSLFHLLIPDLWGNYGWDQTGLYWIWLELNSSKNTVQCIEESDKSYYL